MNKEELVEEVKRLATSYKRNDSAIFEHRQIFENFIKGSYDHILAEPAEQLERMKTGLAIAMQRDTPNVRDYALEASEMLFSHSHFNDQMKPYTRAVAASLVLNGLEFAPYRRVPGSEGISLNSEPLERATAFTTLVGYAKHVEKNEFTGAYTLNRTEYFKIGDSVYYARSLTPTSDFKGMSEKELNALFSEKSYLHEDLDVLKKYQFSATAADEVAIVHKQLMKNKQNNKFEI